jgi:hypothetical protein
MIRRGTGRCVVRDAILITQRDGSAANGQDELGCEGVTGYREDRTTEATLTNVAIGQGYEGVHRSDALVTVQDVQCARTGHVHNNCVGAREK